MKLRPLNPAPADIKAARAEAKLTQARLADLVGVSIRTVKNWESGAHKMQPAAWKLLCMLADGS